MGSLQPATIDPTLDLCTRYPLRLGGPRQCGIWSFPNTSTHGQHWESNPRPFYLESNALSTWPRAPTSSEDEKVVTLNLTQDQIKLSGVSDLKKKYICMVCITLDQSAPKPICDAHYINVQLHFRQMRAWVPISSSSKMRPQYSPDHVHARTISSKTQSD